MTKLLLRAVAVFALATITPQLAQAQSSYPHDTVLGMNDLVCFWDFGEAGGSAISLTPNNYALSEVAGTIPRVVDGPFGSAAYIDWSNNSYFEATSAAVPALNLYKTGPYGEHVTVVAWVKAISGSHAFVAGKWDEGYATTYSQGDRQYGLFLGLNGSPTVNGHVSIHGNNSPGLAFNRDHSISGQTMTLGRWQMVAMSYDGAFSRSYVNGVLVANGTKNPYAYADGMGNNGSPFTIAKNRYAGSMGNSFRGHLGGVAIFKRALTQQELTLLASLTNYAPALPANPISLTSGAPSYTQNFNATTVPNNGKGLPWVDGVTLPGWHVGLTGNSSVPQAYTFWDGTGPQADTLLSLGAPAATERALGSQTDGFGNQIHLSVALKNGTASTINGLQISYDLEQWRTIAPDGGDGWRFEYQIFNTGAGSLATTTGWTQVSALNASAPVTSPAQSSALNGNTTANRVTISGAMSSLNWGVGKELWLRWTDLSPNRHILGLDNFSVAISGTQNPPPPPALSSISVSPASASIETGGIQQFTAVGNSAAGTPLVTQPSFSWSVSGGGTIGSNGLFTAGSTVGGPFTVTATSGSIQGTTSVTVIDTSEPPPGVLYWTENFNNANSSQKGVGIIGWNSYMGATATVLTNVDPASNSNRIGLNNAAGNPGPSLGYLNSVNQTTASQVFAATKTFTAVQPSQISWKMGNGSTGISVRLLVQSGGIWYASTATMTTATTFTLADFQEEAELTIFPYNPAAANWRTFTLSPGTQMYVGGTATADLQSSITGVGFFIQHPSQTAQTFRADTLQIHTAN